jgi:hypothetical protein
MFRKLVSNLPYSPALITEVGFYAKRLKGEDVTRRVTVLFVVLALVMQSLALLSPAESANASSEQDIIRGGVSDLNDFLIRYDHNEDDIKDIYSTVGVSRAEIAAAHPGTIKSGNDTYMMSRYGQLSASQGEITMTYQRSTGGTAIRYFSPLSDVASQYQTFKGWIGKSAALGWFAIIQSNGSLATHGIPTSFSSTGPGATSATKLVAGENLTQNKPAEKTTVEPSDKLSYTLSLSNNRSTSVTGEFTTRVADLLDYTSIVDTGGGTYDQTSNTISWPSVELAPGEKQERTFVVQVLAELPSTSVGQSNPESYDCKLSISFGNKLNAPVDCPAIKTVEAAFYQMPNIDITGNLIFISLLLIIVVFFALRTRQLKKEIRIVRHNFNTGII